MIKNLEHSAKKLNDANLISWIDLLLFDCTLHFLCQSNPKGSGMN